MDLPPALQHQVGPFTVGAWMLIGAAGIGGGLLIKRSGALDGFTQGDGTPTDELPATAATLTRPPGATSSGGTISIPNGAAVGDVPSGPTTNEEWIKQAVAWLSAAQNVNALSADTALRKYAVTGEKLTTAQANMVSMAVTRFGTPPEGAAPAVVIPDPSTTDPTTPNPKWWPAGVRHVRRTITLDNGAYTPALIAAKAYGGTQRWVLVRDANRNKVTDPHQHLPQGLTLYLP